MNKLFIFIAVILLSSTLSFSAYNKLYIDAGAGVAIEEFNYRGYRISGIVSIGYEFVDHFIVYFQFGYGGMNFKDRTSEGYWVSDYLNYTTMTYIFGLDYIYYFGQLGLMGGLSFGGVQKDLNYSQFDAPMHTGSSGFSLGLNAAVSYIVGQHVEPFIRFQYIMAFMDNLSASSPIDHDIAVYIGVRFNIFRNQYLDKGY